MHRTRVNIIIKWLHCHCARSDAGRTDGQDREWNARLCWMLVGIQLESVTQQTDANSVQQLNKYANCYQFNLIWAAVDWKNTSGTSRSRGYAKNIIQPIPVSIKLYYCRLSEHETKRDLVFRAADAITNKIYTIGFSFRWTPEACIYVNNRLFQDK